MKKIFLGSITAWGILALAAAVPLACTNLIVTKGASADGSVMITYTCDGEFHPHLTFTPAQDHGPDEYYELTDWQGNVRGRIKQPPHTYAVVYLMNEHQVTIGETTFTGREELINNQALLHYWWLMRLALQRAKTAREAVEVIGRLVEEYGYRSEGESISIGDPEEAWLLEIIGKGPGSRGANWVALRVPDGYICAHANQARIGSFPLDDEENCLYSKDVIDFAIEKGYYDPDSGEPFSFHKAYCPAPAQKRRYCATRVWSLFRRAAPSRELPVDYQRGAREAAEYPLWIKPDGKLTREDVFALMRDHYEGTDYDMTRGVDAGPFGSPNRWRPMNWKVDGVDYTWERPISTQQTGFSFVSQARSWLPDALGGILWYGVDDTYFTVYVPFYACTDSIPDTFGRGSIGEFSWDSAWWVFNFVANYANLRYSDMKGDIQKVQAELEDKFSLLQPAVEKTALELYRKDHALATAYLTEYSRDASDRVVARYRRLGEYLIQKYNDGYVQDENHRPQEKGYSEGWLRDVIELRPEQFKLKSWGIDSLETNLPY
ncbi:MAG: C69 family dipeptidase [Candidatus Krumholzibacteriota bacterium]|nr:C69 family dipeptidase [Candidatus Krumholzibacteriota bacterium]